MKIIIPLLLTLIFSFSSILATAKTLPKRIFKIDMHTSNYDVVNLGANPSGDKTTWEKVKLEDGTISDIYLVGTYIHDTLLESGIDIAETTKIANSWKKSKLFLDVAYGLTDRLTIFTNISYEFFLIYEWKLISSENKFS